MFSNHMTDSLASEKVIAILDGFVDYVSKIIVRDFLIKS